MSHTLLKFQIIKSYSCATDNCFINTESFFPNTVERIEVSCHNEYICDDGWFQCRIFN